MAALDIITIADLQDFWPSLGSAVLPQLRQHITQESRRIERTLGRRVVFRAPPVSASKDDVVASVLPADGAQALLQTTLAGPRTLILTLTDSTGEVLSGTVTVTGTVDGTAGETEVFDLSEGLIQHGRRFFTVLSAITISSLSIVGTAARLKVGASLGYVEYHSIPCGALLRPLEWPLYHVATIYEDAGCEYAAADLLTVTTDYRVAADGPLGGEITRVSSSLPTSWTSGPRAQKLSYSAGYRLSTVPEDIKSVCRRLVRLAYEEASKGRSGQPQGSDDRGNWSRGSAADILAELDPYVRHRFSETGARDFDLEAS